MNFKVINDASLSEVHESVDTTVKKTGWRRVLSFLGPAYLVSVGYMDPGNWATDLAGGSKFGYTLIWVLLMSNLMALLLQGLAARLGIVRGRDLAQVNRETYPKYINFFLYLLAEIAIAATDLAEVLGMAIGIQLLTGLPLVWGVSITVLDTFLLLFLQRLGIRKMEAFIITLVGVIGISFLVQVLLASPPVGELAMGFIPGKMSEEALYIAIGIIGATVMPHNLYLHSALVQTRKIDRSDAGIRQAIKFNRIDTTIALNLAFFVNAAILIVAATVFFKTGNSQVAEIKEAHRLLPSFLGNVAPVLFAVALIASGQSSTVTGTLAGQIIMEGYLSLRINPMLRRLITRLVAIIPALVVIIVYGENNVDALLILSQVILSLQLGFAIIPLIHFVSDKNKMGKFAIKPITRIAAWVIASVLVFLNLKMLVNEMGTVYADGNTWQQIGLTIGGLLCIGLLLYIIFSPLLIKSTATQSVKIHPERETFRSLD
ncbi:MAG TPA: Nramp family divalent metal transporter, partial [Ferruginibacter sp.]|nr:Nramp family divalent metal transporter [Ferruginibacter sp.]